MVLTPPFINGRGALPAQNKEKLQGDIFSCHFSRETLRDWSKQGNTYIITWSWRYFGVTDMPPKVWWLEGNDRHNTLKEQGIVSRQRSNGWNFSNITKFLQHILIHVPNDSQHGFQPIEHRSMWDTKKAWLIKYNVYPYEEDSNLEIATIHTM